MENNINVCLGVKIRYKLCGLSLYQNECTLTCGLGNRDYQ